jgi:hypothetical protein
MRDGMPVFEAVYHYLVEAESKTTSRLSILRDTTGLPKPGVNYLTDGFAMCKSTVAVQRPEQVLLWDVTAQFSTEVKQGQDSQNPGSDPVEWKPIYETKFERIQEIVTSDFAGVSVGPSSGGLFENGMTRTRSIPIWEFYQFESASVTDEDIVDRNETVNSVSFKGRAAHTLLLTVQSSVIGFYYGQSLRLTQYALKYNYKNWKHKRLDCNVVYLDGGVLKPYLDAGDPANDVPPQVILGPLNGSGGKAATGDPAAELEFEMYEPISFSAFLRI